MTYTKSDKQESYPDHGAGTKTKTPDEALETCHISKIPTGRMQDETTNIDRNPLKTDLLMPPRTEI